MSDLSATQCGCQTRDYDNGNNWLWIIIILLLLCNNGNSCGNSCSNGCGFSLGNLFGQNGSCCEWILILLVISNCCGCNSVF